MNCLPQLLKLIPPPPNPLDPGTLEAWVKVKGALNTGLPRDCESMIDAYGVGTLAGFVNLRSPCATMKWLDYVKWCNETLEHTRGTRATLPEKVPFPVFPEPGGLLPWASTIDADNLYWRTDGSPENWTTVIVGRHELLPDEFPLSTTEFLVKWFSNELSIQVFSDEPFASDEMCFEAWPQQ
ncbi:MAG: hypothetical protein ACYSU0_22985 [Planctomycetota bacterium]|jgi:hypothetical protein